MCAFIAAMISLSKLSNCHLLGDCMTPSREMNSPAITFLMLNSPLFGYRPHPPSVRVNPCLEAVGMHHRVRRRIVGFSFIQFSFIQTERTSHSTFICPFREEAL